MDYVLRSLTSNLYYSISFLSSGSEPSIALRILCEQRRVFGIKQSFVFFIYLLVKYGTCSPLHRSRKLHVEWKRISLVRISPSVVYASLVMKAFLDKIFPT